MKALSLKPYWAMEMFEGRKTVECRTWKTDYRGNILICSSGNDKERGLVCERALIVANLVDIVPFTEEHLESAGMSEMPEGNCYAWIFDGFQNILPFRVKGKLHLFDVDNELINGVDFDDEEDIDKFLDNIVAPMMHRYQPVPGCAPDEEYIRDFFATFGCDESIWS